MPFNQQKNIFRTIAIGDVHGCYRHLEKLLEFVEYSTNDRLIFLGDIIDRGEDPKKTLDFCIELFKENPKSIYIRGNHEDMMLCILTGTSRHSFSLWYLNGGSETMESFDVHSNTLDKLDLKYVNFLEYSIPLYIDEELKMIFAHGGVDPLLPVHKQNLFDEFRGPMWIRADFFRHPDPAPGYVVVFGHTPTNKIIPGLETVYWGGNKIGIDTGICYFNKLTALEIVNNKPLKAYSIDYNFNKSTETMPE